MISAEGLPQGEPVKRQADAGGYQSDPPGGPGRYAADGSIDLVCDPQSQEALEFPQLLEAVAGNASSPMGRDLVRALKPSAQRSTVLRRLKRLSQLRELMAEAGEPGLAGLSDISPFLSRLAVEGAFLLPDELETLAEFIYLVNRAAGFLDQAPEEAEELFRLRNRINPPAPAGPTGAQRGGSGANRSPARPALPWPPYARSLPASANACAASFPACSTNPAWTRYSATRW